MVGVGSLYLLGSAGGPGYPGARFILGHLVTVRRTPTRRSTHDANKGFERQVVQRGFRSPGLSLPGGHAISPSTLHKAVEARAISDLIVS